MIAVKMVERRRAQGPARGEQPGDVTGALRSSEGSLARPDPGCFKSAAFVLPRGRMSPQFAGSLSPIRSAAARVFAA